MQRLIATLLGAALVSATGQIAALHVHAYTGHEHAEHHHGPAVHEHEAPVPHPDDAGTHLESCDPGGHAVSVDTVCTSSARVGGPVAIFGAAIVIREAQLHTLGGLASGVRVHDPPGLRQTPPRAPPLDTPNLIF